MALFPYKRRIKNPNVVLTLLVRDEEDIIDLCVRYHSRAGVSAIIVTDNGSVDGTREILEKHRRDGLIAEIIDEPMHVYRQSAFVDRMIRRARDRYGADYCINCDADEFWYSTRGSLQDDLASSRATKIFCKWCHMLPLLGEPFWNATDRCVKSADEPEKFDIPSYYNLFDTYGCIKIAHRVEGYRQIGLGNHDVAMDGSVSDKSKTIRVYHYGIRSVEQFKRKILQGGPAIEANRDAAETEVTHWRYLYRGYVARRLDLDEEFYKITGAFKREELRKAGVVGFDPTMRDILSTLVG